MKNLKNEKGITLLALGVTILVLLILAGVTIRIIIGENKIIGTSLTATEEYKKEVGKERIKKILGNNILTNIITGEEITAEKVKQSLEGQEGIAQVIITGENEVIVITEEGYIYELIIDGYDQIAIEHIGESTDPIIAIKVTSKNTSSASIEVIGQNLEEAKYKYSYKEEGQEEYTQPVESQNNTYTYTGLKDNTIYNLKVEIETSKGNIEKVKNITTVELPEETPKITLSETSGEIEVESTLVLTATLNITAEEDIVWTSSDNSIATVVGSGTNNSTGTITGLKAGTVTITATYGTEKQSCTVEIKEKAVREITFTIKDYGTFTAIEGWDWATWCADENYNTAGFYIDTGSGLVRPPNNETLAVKSGTGNVFSSNTILSETEYYVPTNNHVGGSN